MSDLTISYAAGLEAVLVWATGSGTSGVFGLDSSVTGSAIISDLVVNDESDSCLVGCF